MFQKRALKYILLVLLFWNLLLPAELFAIAWEHSYERGMQSAAQTGKPILVGFYTDWCGWCRKLDREVYPSAKVQRFSTQFVFVKIDCERNQSIPRKYGIRGYPTIIILAPDGQVIRNISGFVGAERLAGFMKEAVNKVGPPKKSHAPSASTYSTQIKDFDYPEETVTKARQFYNLGRKMEERGRIPQAQRFYQKVLGLVPGTTLARKTEARIKRLENM